MKDQFLEALKGKKIPILTLDNKWYKLLDESSRKAVAKKEEELNSLLKRQGKLNTELKEIKKLKKNLMNEIMQMAQEATQSGNKAGEKKMEQNKRLVEECNEKLESYQDELMDLPKQIDQINFQLMLMTMEHCYDILQENTTEIEEITDWVTKIRIELKKNLVKKQEMEQRNHTIYSYMHDVFGADVVNMFDLKYNPDEQHPRMPGQEKPNKSEE